MATGDLTTLANVKAWLNIPAANTTDDALLTRLISAASQFAQTYMNRTIPVTSYTITVDGPGGTTLQPREHPITAVASVNIDGVSLPVSTGPGAAGFRFTQTQIIVEGYRFWRGNGNVAVAYSAGYATTPLDLEQAVIEMLSMRYKERDRIGFVSKSLAGETVMYSIKDMPDSARTIFRNYANVSPV